MVLIVKNFILRSLSLLKLSQPIFRYKEYSCQNIAIAIVSSFLHNQSWASADFFPGEGKNFPGGARTYFLPKKQRKRYYFSQKSLKTYYFWPALAGQGGQEPPLALPCGRPCNQW
jgi:hypothetical protein